MTYKKQIYVMLGLLSASLLACNSDNGLRDPNLSSSSSDAITVPVTNASLVSDVEAQVHPATRLGNLMNMNTPRANFTTSAGLNPAHGMPGHNCDVAVGAPLPGASSASSIPSMPNLTRSDLAINPAHGMPGHDCAVAVGAPLPSGSAIASTPNLTASNLNINPAHGQPGHDCAVAVGAPLPSAVASTPNLTTSNLTINPAHGQPGHDCAIAVGAPLTGAAVASSAASTPVPVGLSNLVAPVATTPNFNVDLGAGASAKLNPAHGQPGHDCSIAVGAPLTSSNVKINPAHGLPGHDCAVAVGAPLPS